MTVLQINTTQNVNIHFTAASLGERILAYIVDFILIASYTFGIFYLLGQAGVFEIENDWSKIALTMLALLPAMVYTLVMEILMQGQTLGKKVLNIKVVKLDGYQASILDYFMRWLFRIVDIYIGFGTGGIAILSIALSQNSQRLGDMAAGTSVISLKDTYNINHTILEELTQNYQPSFPSVINLSDKDVQIVKDMYHKALATRDHSMLIKLRTKVEEITKTSRGTMSDETYIRIILKDYSHFTQNM